MDKEKEFFYKVFNDFYEFGFSSRRFVDYMSVMCLPRAMGDRCPVVKGLGKCNLCSFALTKEENIIKFFINSSVDKRQRKEELIRIASNGYYLFLKDEVLSRDRTALDDVYPSIISMDGKLISAYNFVGNYFEGKEDELLSLFLNKYMRNKKND